jgi:hypothetical protein
LFVESQEAHVIEFSPKDLEDLARLLGMVAANNGYWPDETTMRAAHAAVSYWAPEVVVTRHNRGVEEILLTLYEGGAEFFVGKWHIPGGYAKRNEPDLQATCSRHAKAGIGVDVRYAGIIDEYKWAPGEHPYGHPLSLFCRCVPVRQVVETDSRKFFAKAELPPNIVVPHRRFIMKDF